MKTARFFAVCHSHVHLSGLRVEVRITIILPESRNKRRRVYRSAFEDGWLAGTDFTIWSAGCWSSHNQF